MSLASRVVAITGASAGIGRACAEQLAGAGASLALLARRADRLRAVADPLTANGARVLVVPGDVTQEDDVRALVTRAVETFGRLDVMICNAGIGYHGPFETTSSEVARRLVDVNLLGTIYAALAAVDVFRRQGSGHLIAVSSIVGRRGIGGSAVYSATKAAQIGLIEALRAEFIDSGLRASLVYPVSTDTEFHEAMARDFAQDVGGHGPQQSAEDVARAIVACIRRPRAEVYPYGAAKILAMLSVAAPGTTDRVVQRYRRSSIARQKPAGPSRP